MGVYINEYIYYHYSTRSLAGIVRYPGRNDVQGLARALHNKDHFLKILARLEFGLQDFYGPFSEHKVITGYLGIGFIRSSTLS